jgi:hypothetical protein
MPGPKFGPAHQPQGAHDRFGRALHARAKRASLKIGMKRTRKVERMS